METVREMEIRLEAEGQKEGLPYYTIPKILRDTTNILPFRKGLKGAFAWWVHAKTPQDEETKKYGQFQRMAYWSKGIRTWKGNFALVLGDPLGIGLYWIDIDIDDPKYWDYYKNEEGYKYKSKRGYHVLKLVNKQIGAIEAAPGVSIRTKGIVIIPPSIHPSGAKYEWVS